MATMPPEGDQEWIHWLEERGLDDPSLSAQQLYLRYNRFKDIKWGLPSEQEQVLLLKDLLPIEGGLVYGNAIGQADEFPFNFTVSDATPIKQKAIPYARQERAWIRDYIEKQIELGIMERVNPGEEEPLFCVGAVLVKDGQSGQSYRFCANMVMPNSRVDPSAAPLVDVTCAVDELEGGVYCSAADIKAGFFNIILKFGLEKFLGIVTQDGLFRFKRMPFGHKNAPAHFQGVMNAQMAKARWPIQQGTYLDDVTIVGQTLEQTWKDTVEGLKCLIAAGFPINIKKCQFLCKSCTVLGYVLADEQYQLGRKSMAKLFAKQLPKSLLELQQLMGMLNYTAPFVSDYKRIAQPLIDLMSSSGGQKWTQTHTDCLNQLGEIIWSRFKISLVNMKQPAKLYIDADERHCSAILTQGELVDLRICAMAGRQLEATEKKCPMIEKQLLTALWAFKRMGRYCFYLPKVSVMLPNVAELTLVGCNDLPVRLQAKLIELSSLGITFECGMGAFQLSGELARVIQEPPEPKDHQLDLPFWQHQDLEIDFPSKPEPTQMDPNDISFHFDGACANKTCAAGLVAFRGERMIGGRYIYFGTNYGGNNISEASSLKECLLWIQQEFTSVKGQVINVIGDNNLCISFMRGEAKPKLRQLVSLIDECKVLAKQIKGIVKFFHVKRAYNQYADFMSQIALKTAATGTLEDIPTDTRLRELKVKVPAGFFENDRAFMHQEVCGITKPACKRCGLSAGSDRLLECGGCEKWLHVKCVKAKYIPQRKGPWYCAQCRKYYQKTKLRDIMLDEDLLNFLSHRQAPLDLKQYQRVLKASRYLSMDEDGKVWVTGPAAGPPRQVPPLNQRKKLLQLNISTGAYPSGDRLYQMLRQSFFWEGMLLDCREAADTALPRQLEQANYKSPRYLYPTNKGLMPFAGWSIDTLPNLSPAAPNGGTSVIVCVDIVTKWVEIGILPLHDSQSTTQWFHENITCRFGCPDFVRSDQGTEYQGKFHAYLVAMGIWHRPIATMNPRANGQVERFNRVVKQGIRKFSAACPGSQWWDFLQDIARASRLIPAAATGFSPYILVFKQSPKIPFPAQLGEFKEAELEDLTSEQVTQLTSSFKLLAEEIQRRQEIYDEKMVAQYHKRGDLQQQDIRFIFEAGDQVMLKNREYGATKCRSVGPYWFVRYLGNLCTQATIVNVRGQEKIVSVANILPVRKPAQRTLRFTPSRLSEQPGITISESAVEYSDGDSQLPPGTVLVPPP